MPCFLLKPIHIAWLTAINVSLTNRYADFLAYRLLTLRNATITSSTIRLTQALWDNFDSTNKAYILQNTTFHQSVYVYLYNENPAPLFDYLNADNHSLEYDYLFSEDSLIGGNFTVRIPVAIASKKQAVIAFVKKYVFSGITFSVETF